MTLTIDRPVAGGSGEERTGSGLDSSDGAVTWPIRLMIAALGVGPAALHFAMIPSHAAGSTLQAIGFAVAGWLGLVLAIGSLVRPSRRLVIATVALNAAMIATWVWSRSSGLPIGSHAGHRESATAVDMLATGLEAAAIVTCLAVLARPALGRTLGIAGGVVGGAVAAFAMIATSVALASPSARDHASVAHGDVAAGAGAGLVSADGHAHDNGTGLHEGILATTPPVVLGDVAAANTIGHEPGQVHPAAAHSHGDDVVAGPHTHDDGIAVDPADSGGGGSTPVAISGSSGAEAGDSASAHNHGAAAAVPLADRCDLAINPVSFWQETTIVHEDGADASKVVGSPELDELVRETVKPGGEAKDAAVVARLGQLDDDTYESWLNWLPAYVGDAHAHASSGAPDDNGGHGGHLGPQMWMPMTNPAECDELVKELDRVREIALKYPTPVEAEAGGWRRVTGYVPGIAAHYMNFGYVDGEFNLDEPEMLLYDNDEPNASIVGLSYYLIHESDFEPTQGFTGPNDHFHRHVGLCVGAGGVVGDSTLTAEECAARGGKKSGGTGGWMNHVWIVPGCESPWGMFSGASPLLERTLTDRSGTDGGGCAGSGVADRYDLTPGSSETVPAGLIGG